MREKSQEGRKSPAQAVSTACVGARSKDKLTPAHTFVIEQAVPSLERPDPKKKRGCRLQTWDVKAFETVYRVVAALEHWTSRCLGCLNCTCGRGNVKYFTSGALVTTRRCRCLYLCLWDLEVTRAQALTAWTKEHFWWQSLAEWMQLAAGYTKGLAPVPGSWDSPTFLPFANLCRCFSLLNTTKTSVILEMKSQTGNEKLRVSWFYWGLYWSESSLSSDLYFYETSPTTNGGVKRHHHLLCWVALSLVGTNATTWPKKQCV